MAKMPEEIDLSACADFLLKFYDSVFRIILFDGNLGCIPGEWLTNACARKTNLFGDVI